MQSTAPATMPAARQKISDAERAARRRACEISLANVALEGLRPDDATLAKAERFINGEIELEEFVRT